MSPTNQICEMAPPAPPMAETPRPRACLVSEDDAVLVSLKFLFKAAGFEVRAFRNGKGLLASSAMRRADCFILDHRPRGLDGMDLARKLRSLGLGAPIVLTTGFRCGALETLANASLRVIAAPRVDEALIEELMRGIESGRAGLRQST